MKIAGVNYPEPLLDALRDGRLVVFAGAGVSMGPPAGLPDFGKLARRIAKGTSLTIGDNETEDQFLGRLEHGGTKVHELAARVLLANDPESTELHRNLLRLYTNPEDVLIVTTNFDLLFEQAADDIFNKEPQVFQPPALPQGPRFQGIVHIHGSVNEPKKMVLTEGDFGRAYLIESDGWARRFLVELFANYTVLFVGYSHRDAIMKYLTSSLPRDGNQKRFALIGDWSSDVQDHWLPMGVEPVTFNQKDANDFTDLDTAVGGLANLIGLSDLEWQHKITAVASGYPPMGLIDDEITGIIKHALSDPVKTRFFIESAEKPEWLVWLDRRGHLKNLFTDGKLSQRDQQLVRWLVSRFALTHDGALFALIARHGRRLNPTLWRQLSLQMQDSIPQSPDAAVTTRWVLCLASVIPTDADEYALSCLAKACASVGATDSLLRVYEAMTERIDRAPPPTEWHDANPFHDALREMLSECIKPHLPEMAEPLLAVTTMRLNSRHAVLAAWKEGDATLDWDSSSRQAIEPHEQDDLNRDIDPLIDTARECLEWLAINRADVARQWSELYVGSGAPLLRRLAVHTLSVRTDLSADDKITWLLDKCEIHENATLHEIFRAASIAYPCADLERRSAFINAVLAYRWPQETEPDKERYTALRHFRWLHWLCEAAPDCEFTRQALVKVQEQHPEFQPSEHPDFLIYHTPGEGWGIQSPWTVDTLLARPPDEALLSLLEYQPAEGEVSDRYDRWESLRPVADAAKRNPAWGLDIADTMVRSSSWNNDLWQHVIQAWAAMECNGVELNRVLGHLSADKLHQAHAHDIAHTLCSIVRTANVTEPDQWLSKANAIAVALQQYAIIADVPEITATVGGVPQEVDWMGIAINHPFGALAQFWVQSIGLWRRQQETPPPPLNDEYRSALDGILQDNGVAGKLGRAILARFFPFLHDVDETWAVQNLIPLLKPGAQ